MVFPRGIGSIAECVDLDLAVGRASSIEAVSSLEDAMKGYLKVVFQGDTHDLLPRKSPLSHRIRFRSIQIAHDFPLFRRSKGNSWTTESRCVQERGFT